MSQTICVEVVEWSQPGEARRRATTLATAIGFSAEGTGKVALVATELATNLVKHAQGGGEILLTAFERNGERGIEVMSVDSGPGIPNLAEALTDGYSTAGSAGDGLGVVSRLAEVDVHSQVGEGTPCPRDSIDLGGVCVPWADADACGDAWAVAQDDRTLRMVLADGLGHGEYAALAADAAVRVFRERPDRSPTDHLQAMHTELRQTRGAAVGVVEIDCATGSIHYAGVGNTTATIVNGDTSRGLASNNGTVGHVMRNVRVVSDTLAPGATLVMTTDGLRTRWRLDRYAGIARRDPAVAAALLRRDFDRTRDDVTVVVARRANGAA
jgi:anti-sigma regulatory factor (Ser/Thr protein kinase)